MDRSHWCFPCHCIRTPDALDVCKELNHDIDEDDQYTPPHKVVEIETPVKKTHSTKDEKYNLLEFAKKNIQRVYVSSSDSSQFYGLVEIDGHLETINLNSNDALDWLISKYYQKFEEFHGTEMYDGVLSLIKAQAKYSKAVEPTSVNKRICSDNDSIYLDLGNPDWRLVKITSDGTSIVEHGKNTPIFFRGKNSTRISEPKLNFQGNPLDDFCNLVRLGNDPIFKIHLIQMFLAHIPTPIMFVNGEEGSAKSIRCALIKKLVDPSGQKLEEQLGQFGRNNDDLNIHFANNYLVTFDNVSYISAEQSDTICKAITGSSYSKRKNYEDANEIVLKFQRKILANGIGVKIEHGDFERRTIHYFTDRIPENEIKTLSQVDEEFKKIQPDLLGQICSILSKAISIYPEVEKTTNELPNMADFAIWGECISIVLGFEKGKFLTDYKSRLKSNSDLLNENNCIISFLEHVFEGKTESEIINSNGRWYGELGRFADDENIDRKSRNFPKGANFLRSWIERSQPLLHQHNFEVVFESNTTHKEFTKHATLMKVKRKKSQQEKLI